MQEQTTHQQPPDAGAGQEAFTAEELTAAVQVATKRIIRKQLRVYGLDERWAEDVAGEVIASAWQARHQFDPQLGVLQAWISRIAQRRCADRVEKEVKRNGTLLAADRDAEGRSVDEQLDIAAAKAAAARGEVDDIAVEVAEKMAVDSWLTPVMAVTSKVMDERAYKCGFLTYTRFDGSIKDAAEAFGLPTARVREFKRSLELHAQVVMRAFMAQDRLAGAPPRVQDLVDCLPEEDQPGAWTRRMAEAIASWPGKASTVTVEHVQAHTGWTYDTSRQYLNYARRLLQVAWSVINGPSPKQLAAESGR